MAAIKDRFQAASASRPDTSATTPQADAPVLESEKISAQMDQAEREFIAAREQLRAENNALSERRRPACESIARLRTLAETVVNGRRFLGAAKARAAAFDALVASQFGGGVTDISLIARLQDGDLASATAERLAEHIDRWLAVKEPALADAIKEARQLAASAPDNAPLLADLAAIEASMA